MSLAVELEKERGKSDKLMNELIKDPKILEMLVEKLKELRLDEDVEEG